MTGLAEGPIFQALKRRLDFLETRQKLISENVANATTPGYTPRDADEAAFARRLERSMTSPQSFRLATTDAGHVPGVRGGGAANVRVVNAPDSETTLDGNRVVLEEQMFRMSQNRTEFETAVGLYQKALAIVRLAARAPGR